MVFLGREQSAGSNKFYFKTIKYGDVRKGEYKNRNSNHLWRTSSQYFPNSVIMQAGKNETSLSGFFQNPTQFGHSLQSFSL